MRLWPLRRAAAIAALASARPMPQPRYSVRTYRRFISAVRASRRRKPTQPAAAPPSFASSSARYPSGSAASSAPKEVKQQGSSTPRAYSTKRTRTSSTSAGAVASTSVAIYYCSMRLHQLKVDYEAEQDRLVMLVATNEGVELRLTLTRRFVKLLWPLLVKLAEEASPRIRTQANPEARKALLGLEHEHAVSKADFSKPYDAGGSARPLGDAPLLLARIQTGHDRNGQPVVALHPSQGQGITLTFDSVLLHSVCRLLQAAVRKSDWDMELKLPGTEPQDSAERPARTLN